MMSNQDGNSQSNEWIEIITQSPNNIERWRPNVGNGILDLLRRVSASSRQTLQNESIRILSRCISPQESKGRETGLVIGYVQSGKTLSFTAVSALAQDNNYQMIIVITGISINLFNQSLDRIKKDLQPNERGHRWKLYSSDKFDDSVLKSIKNALEDWKDKTVPENERRTVLITVMKQRAHLDKLIDLLSDGKIQLDGVLTLIIDDECDQAGLNNLVKQGEQSATYRRLLRLRDCLPLHTYLQYTATPQAPLLINIIDSLSPSFVEVLTPGSAYTGGKIFFEEQNTQLIRIVPHSNIPSKKNTITAPPESLLEALRIYFLGAAASLIITTEERNRSMMVHPSKETASHVDYLRWVTSIMGNWQKILARPEEPDHKDLYEEFRQSYIDLQMTVENLPSFDEIFEKLRRVIRKTITVEVNARGKTTPLIDWDKDDFYILVGGQALDRGYTVKGLTVTYMPRSKGVGNADTVQQRARWFGYKADYLGFCRVYLSDQIFHAYKIYVEHEEDIRERLRRFNETGRSFKDWKRAFFLDPLLKPTRKNVLDLEYTRGDFAGDWFAPRYPHASMDAIEANRAIVKRFLSNLQSKLKPDEGHQKRTEDQKHMIASDVSLDEVFSQLLIQTNWANGVDSQKFTGLLLQLAKYLEQDPKEKCVVYYMVNGKQRTRAIESAGNINQLFQGPDYIDGDTRYPGDREVKSKDLVTVQIHNLCLKSDKETTENVPVIAVHLPGKMSGSWLVQDQGKSID